MLTKADTVTNGETFERWLGIINGFDPEHQLAHGYYVTMQQRSSPDATWQENLEDETTFFNSSPLWSKSGVHSRIGCLELRKKLSIELSCLIKERFISCLGSILINLEFPA